MGWARAKDLESRDGLEVLEQGSWTWVASEPPRGLVTAQVPERRLQPVGLGGAWKHAFLTSSQGMQVLLTLTQAYAVSTIVLERNWKEEGMAGAWYAGGE